MPNSKSFDLLVYKTAYKRHRDTIDELSNPLVMDDDGKVWRGAEQVAPEQVQPRAAWANRDLYNEGPVRAFMVACLKSKNLQWMQSSAAGFEAPVFGKLVGNVVVIRQFLLDPRRMLRIIGSDNRFHDLRVLLVERREALQ